MSRVDLGGPPSLKRWEYMTLQMAEGLGAIADGTVSPGQIPKGILADAVRFLNSAKGAAQGRLFGLILADPLGSNDTNRQYAHRALEQAGATRIPSIPKQENPDLELFILADFIECLGRPLHFYESSLRPAARWATSFFEALAGIAQSET